LFSSPSSSETLAQLSTSFESPRLANKVIGWQWGLTAGADFALNPLGIALPLAQNEDFSTTVVTVTSPADLQRPFAPGFSVGAFARVAVHKNWAFSAELNARQRSGMALRPAGNTINYQEFYSDTVYNAGTTPGINTIAIEQVRVGYQQFTARQFWLELPLLAEWSPRGGRHTLMAGVRGSLRIASLDRIESITESSLLDQTSNNNISSSVSIRRSDREFNSAQAQLVTGLDAGVTFGYGFKFNRHWSANLRYTQGLRNLTNDPAFANARLFNSDLRLQLRYAF
jgi:hypothetical protein